jgi:broad specificity phosphatase PhoE
LHERLETFSLKPTQVISSPLARAQETALPLADALSLDIFTEARVAELPSPEMHLDERGPWLRQILTGSWAESGALIQQWRQNIIHYLQDLNQTQVIFTHFVVINAVASHILKDEKVLSFYPDNASVTHLRLKNGELELVSLGNESKTVIN